MSNFEKFKEQLPSKEKFYSSLTGKKISQYEHVIKVWNRLEMKMMKNYQDLHLKCGVLLLADVFEKLRNNSLKNYGLHPSHYLNAPALSWDAMLNMTKVELQLISDLDMYIFFQKGMRGGVSYISNRYSKANNKYLKSYDLQKESIHIIYLDANNLYGYDMSKFLPTSCFKYLKSYDLKKESTHNIYLDANNLYGYDMSKFLPTSCFKWLDPKKIDLNKYTSNSSKRCVLEGDFKYP